MKHDKINFFQSPLPNHFRQHLLLASPQRDCLDDPLFATPFKPSLLTGPLLTLPQVKGLLDGQQSPFSDLPGSSSDPLLDESLSMVPQINRKISFSQEEQEDLLAVLTPQRKGLLCDNLDNTSTVQKKNKGSAGSPLSLCQRGLKKLAYEAYLFVSGQRRTSYKEVARKLIGQLNDEGQMEIEKKGEMNIKRRVYDALNVLIALGLLKRNGNKIIGSRGQQVLTARNNTLEPHQPMESKQLANVEEKQILQKCLKSREEIVAQKKKLLQNLQQKVKIVRELENRNKAYPSFKPNIKMPFVVLASSGQTGSSDPKLRIWSQEDTFQACYPIGSMQMMGDLDVLNRLRFDRPRRVSKR